jgi:sugar O-acyltransferase (sialic acid O-acetyltransferase NeuD family)
MKEKALIGFGGHAREVMSQMSVKLPCFVDDRFVTDGCLPLSSLDPEIYCVMVAIADSVSRQEIINKLPDKIEYFTFIHPTVLIMSDDVEIGEGSFIGAYSIITTNIKIGSHAILNRGNHIGHDSVIGNFFSAMPGSIVSGNSNIGSRVYMGTNSSVIEKKNICEDVIIGANSCVIRDIIISGTYVGCPCKKI